MTPAELKRQWMVNILFAFGAICLLVAIALTGVIWLGQWPAELAGKRLDYLAWSLMGYLMGSFFTAGAFALGGPIGRFSMKFKGAEMTAEDDDR